MGKEYTTLLKEVNLQASEVIKEINAEQDETSRMLLITQFGNEVFQKGVNFGLNEKINLIGIEK